MSIVISILKMLGGLVLLIYGMQVLSNNLKKISGGSLEKVLLNVTNNAFKGLFVGFLITAIIHSSAATTVVVVGLVGAGILTLKNAIPIIMGANVGTTINAQILRLAGISSDSFLSLFTPECFAPMLLIAGLIVMNRGKKQKTKDIGELVMALGMLFTGMITMMNVASVFSDLPILATILQHLSNPILGVIAGALITALVQSSTATIGILQALSTTGMITYAMVIPIILGQNIGTCVTSIFASIGGNTNAKRVAAVHLYFNLIGTILFLVGIYSYQHFIGFSFWNNAIDMGRIADFHTIFNVVCTIVLFPFLGALEKLTIFTVRDNKKEEDEGDADHLVALNMLDEKLATIPHIAISNSVKVIEKMEEIADKSYKRSIQLVDSFDNKLLEKIENSKDNLYKIEEELTKYLVKLENLSLTEDENNKITTLLNIESEVKKIGDYSYRLAIVSQDMNEKDVVFSSDAKEELKVMFDITQEAIHKSMKLYKTRNDKMSIEIEALKELAASKREEFKSIHIQRLKKGACSVESGIAFLDILNVCDSIVNHCSHLSDAISSLNTESNSYDYRNKQIDNKLKTYHKKYSKV